ncbi:hypothetical protein JOD47_000340 [Arthrobacter tumbae]|nr:hypothetical protein [Arthrobacter tumbae]
MTDVACAAAVSQPDVRALLPFSRMPLMAVHDEVSLAA